LVQVQRKNNFDVRTMTAKTREEEYMIKRNFDEGILNEEL